MQMGSKVVDQRNKAYQSVVQVMLSDHGSWDVALPSWISPVSCSPDNPNQSGSPLLAAAKHSSPSPWHA